MYNSKFGNRFMKPYKPVRRPYNFHSKMKPPTRENTKIRNPVKYLVEKQKMPKKVSQQFLAQPAVIHKYWKEDNSGFYMNKEFLDSVGYGWREERKEFTESLESTEELREVSRKSMLKEYGKQLSMKEVGEKIKGLPEKYQKRLGRTQRIMKKITR